jgi:hypothetical protein
MPFGEPGSPCGLCGVRPDVACSHRPADPGWAPPDQDRDPPDRRLLGLSAGNGWNFHGRRKPGPKVRPS